MKNKFKTINMEANELRIGNYTYNDKEELFKVCWINNSIKGMLKPIPLTEEWYRKVEKQLIKKGFSYGFERGKLTLYLSDEWEFESEFLHQLQNLYFALTNEELTIKL